MDRVRPSGPQGLFHPVLAASSSTNQLNAVQYGGWRRLLSEGKLQLSEIRENFTQKVRISGVCNMVVCIAARTQNVAGDRHDKKQLILTEL
jgi:hypothetical protein